MWRMMFWILSGLLALTIAAILLLGNARGARDRLTGAESDMAVYRDQLDEVDRDLARGVLTENEAEAVRIEISRRLLEADKRTGGSHQTSEGGQAIARVLIPVVLLAGSGALYVWIGAPGYRDMPMDQRLAAIAEANESRPDQAEAERLAAASLPKPQDIDPDFLDLMEQLRATLEERPNDIPGLMLLARNEARLGNYSAAREAQERLVAAKGDRATSGDLAGAAEMLIFAAGGYVSPEAETYIRRLLTREPGHEEGRYFLGYFYIQTGRPDLAFPIWRRLLEESSPNAPWVPVIAEDIGGLAAAAGVNYTPPDLPGLTGPTSADIAAAEGMSAEDRQTMIQGMVDGLADRLATEGGPPEDWARLVTALTVLGEDQRARAIYAEAKSIWGNSEDAMRILLRAGIDAGLE